jgi:hypothetical protein
VKRGRKRKSGLYGGKLLALALFVAVGIAWGISFDAVVGGSGTETEKEVFGGLTAVFVLTAFTLAVSLMGRGSGLVIGVDNRISTSKVQVVIWTYAISGAIICLIAQTWVGLDKGFDALFSGDFDFEPYLVLLGGPFLAAVGARALVGAQVENGDSAKPPGKPSASQVVTGDSGNADLVDCQYLLFNLIAVMYFLGAFIEDTSAGLPSIPTLLFVLTGASALGYVTSKAIPSGPPTLASISPSVGHVGSEVTVFGSGLLFPRDATATSHPTHLAQFQEVQVMVGGRRAEIVDGTLSSNQAGGDRFGLKIPTALEAGKDYDVVALNFRGTATEPVKFKIEQAKRRGAIRRNGRKAARVG